MRAPFENRAAAGQQLAAALARYKATRCVVFALPRGGVPIGAEIATSLRAPLDILLVRKIGLPGHPELAMGAVVDGGTPTIVRNVELIRTTGVGDDAFRSICEKELAEIERRRALYASGRPLTDPKDRIAIVVDDGIATGATMRAALQAIRKQNPKRLILAVPVASHDALETLSPEADEIVCLAVPEPFGAVGYYYRDFTQTTDDEVVSLLARNRELLKASKRPVATQ